jgi:sulfur relay (sulfurtransferase) DsrF/TusC family protein
MGAPVLILISADPHTSHRANEALRIALGILAGENEVRIILRDRAAAALEEDTDDLVDGDDIARHLSTLVKLGQAFHVDESALPGIERNGEGLTLVPVSPAEIADLVARSERVLVFQ